MVETAGADHDETCASLYLGAGPFTLHIYIADGKKEIHKPNRFVFHYGDDELEVSEEQVWNVAKELFGN